MSYDDQRAGWAALGADQDCAWAVSCRSRAGDEPCDGHGRAHHVQQRDPGDPLRQRPPVRLPEP
jgi:hypothetical protein